jgi:hypothetical protein
MLGGDPGHQRLGPITPGHPKQIRPGGHSPPRQLRHIHHTWALKQRHLGPERLGLVVQPAPGDLRAPTAGFMIIRR